MVAEPGRFLALVESYAAAAPLRLGTHRGAEDPAAGLRGARGLAGRALTCAGRTSCSRAMSPTPRSPAAASCAPRRISRAGRCRCSSSAGSCSPRGFGCYPPAGGREIAHRGDDPVLRGGVEIGMHGQAQHLAGQALGGAQAGGRARVAGGRPVADGAARGSRSGSVSRPRRAPPGGGRGAARRWCRAPGWTDCRRRRPASSRGREGRRRSVRRPAGALPAPRRRSSSWRAGPPPAGCRAGC